MLQLGSLPPLGISKDPLPESIINTVETIQFCVFCFTVPFYTFIIYFIIDGQSRKIVSFSTPFFKLCLSTAIIDLLSLFNNYFGSMFPKWGWGINVYLYLDGIYAHTYYYITWMVSTNQAMCAAMLTANRLSAILFPHRYKKLWANRNLYIAFTLQFTPGIIFSILTLFNPTQLYRNKNDGLVAAFTNESLTEIFFISGGIYLVIICIFLVASYCYLFYVIRQRGQRNLTNHSRNDESYKKAKDSAKIREFKLFLMSSAIVFVQILLFLLILNHFLAVIEMSSDGFHLVYNVVSDIYSSINPYLLWIFSDSLRSYILTRIGLKKDNKPRASVISVNIAT